MRFDKSTLKKFWKDLGVFLMVGFTFGLIFAVGISFLKVYEDSMRVKQRARLVVSIVQEQRDMLFHEQAGTASVAHSKAPTYSDTSFSRRWIIERFAAANKDPRLVEKDLERVLNHPQANSNELVSLKRWQSALSSWASEDEKNSRALLLLIEGRQHYFESAGFRRIGKADDGAVLDLWTISLLSKFVEKYPLHPAVPEALFMMGDEYMNLGSALPKGAKGDRILNLVSELYPDSIWASRANAIWKSEHSNAI